VRRLSGLRARAAVLVVGALATGQLAACSAGGRPSPAVDVRAGSSDGALDVVATFTVLADVVTVVGGDDVVVGSVTGPGMNVHGYEPTPDDLRRAAAADLVVANGLGLETWLHDLIDPLGVPVVVVGDAVDPLPIRGPLHETGGLAHNPHAWMSPRAGQAYVAAVADALAAADPANAGDYAARAAGLSAQLADLAVELEAAVAALPQERRVLVTCEGAFSYLARDVGLQEAYLWPVNAERQGTPRQAARVIDTVREAEVPAVFCEWTVPSTAQRQVARETGARFAGELYVDSLTGPDGPVPTYLELLRYDAELIARGLAGEGDR
jgi:manganese transport system substrate-binding protein